MPESHHNIDQEVHILVIENSNRQRFVLDAATCSIGRDPTNAITIDDKSISRKHAHLMRVRIPGTNRYGYRLIDGDHKGKRSANGTFVNGEPCRFHDLSEGDAIQFGRHVKAAYRVLSKRDPEVMRDLTSTKYYYAKADLIDAKGTVIAAEVEMDDFASADEHKGGVGSGQRVITATQEAITAAKTDRPSQVEAKDVTTTPTIVTGYHPYRSWMILLGGMIIASVAILIWVHVGFNRQEPSTPTRNQPQHVDP